MKLHELKQESKGYLINLRPYSWVDAVLIGYLAKFSVGGETTLSLADMRFVLGLLGLWFFFNLVLEIKHSYAYRARVSPLSAIICLTAIIVVNWQTGFTYSSVWAMLSLLFVAAYLFKSRGKFGGNFSPVARGLVQVSYFLFVVFMFPSADLGRASWLGAMIFLLYASRALIGDIRDIAQNGAVGRKTVPISYGERATRLAVVVLLVAAGVIQIWLFSFAAAVPVILYSISILCYRNGYVLHQLGIFTTTFFSANLIALAIGEDVMSILLDIIYLGTWLNLQFYPLLARGTGAPNSKVL